MRKYKKGDLITIGTAPFIYTVTKDETVTGRVHCKRGDRSYVFNEHRGDPINLYIETPEEEK